MRQISWFDRLLRTLPFSEEDIQRAITWVVVAALAVLALAAAQWFGLIAAAHQQYAELAAKAGFQVQRVEVTGMERVDQLKVYELVLAEKDRAMPLVDIERCAPTCLNMAGSRMHVFRGDCPIRLRWKSSSASLPLSGSATANIR